MKKKKSTAWFTISFIFLVAVILTVSAIEKAPIKVSYIVLDIVFLAISYITCCHATKLFDKGE